MDMMFNFEELKDERTGHPVFLVRQNEGWHHYAILGVVRQATRSRFNLPLMWTAALSLETDPMRWPEKSTSGLYAEKEHAAIWLRGARDALLVGSKDAARAIHDEEIRQMTAPSLCPVCEGKAVGDPNTHPQAKKDSFGRDRRDDIRCRTCDVELFRINETLPYGRRPLWQFAGVVHYGESRSACNELSTADACVTDIPKVTCEECIRIVHQPV
ncbi:hypothetical protein [Streptomyces sp. NPDC017448]|uniref:hypothetical protein n=1 Tax=Streptomyces sp. NPDC017448 TaxID=3364996 RepID=UPI0037BD6E85